MTLNPNPDKIEVTKHKALTIPRKDAANMKHNNPMKFIATGDLFMTRRLPKEGYEGFEEIRDCIMEHDVKFNNLEMTFHDQEGTPASVSGGTWAMMESKALDDVLRFGFNLFTTANNHSGDYGEGGVLATMKHLKDRDMVFSGTGSNLAEAAKACYLETRKARVALISVSASFSESSRAGGQSIEHAGRPGLNPLRSRTIYHLDPEHYAMIQELAKITGVNDSQEYSIACGYSNPFPEGVLPFGKAGDFALDDHNWKETVPNAKDMERVKLEIEEARRQADVVLVSFHSHEARGKDQSIPAMFLETFSRACIDAGADVILGHGPHELRGIELYKGGVIFYSLGNFLFETETISLQPYDAYDNRGMAQTTKVGEYMDNRSKNGTVGYGVLPNIWRSVMAGWTMEDGKVTQIQLYPIDLGMTRKRSQKGTPVMGSEDVLHYLQTLCDPYGTKIRIENGVGYIDLK